MNGKANRPRKRSPETRDRILIAARSLFAVHGFDGTTTASIARKAKVNEALIFRHFPAKIDLYEAILRTKLEDEGLSRILQAAEDSALPADATLRLIAQSIANYSDPEFLRLYFYSALEGHPLAAGFYEEFVARLTGAVEKVVRRGIREGRFRKIDARVVAYTFTGFLRNHCLTRSLFPAYALATADLSVQIGGCELLLKGLAKQPRRSTAARQKPPKKPAKD